MREERSRRVKELVARWNPAELEIMQLCGEELTVDERAVVMLSDGASIATVVAETGCPKCRVEVFREELFGRRPMRDRGVYSELEPEVIRLRAQGLSYKVISEALGVSHKYVRNALARSRNV